jgi:hypothetical protein
MDYSEKWGNSVEEAVALALKDLKLTIDEVDVEVLEEPTKGILGLGRKPGLVRVTKKGKTVEKAGVDGDDKENDYSESFMQLASAWLSKLDGEMTSQKIDTRFGVVNRILNKYKADELFDVGENDVIRPTRKLKDLMPYFLRKDRIAEIQGWIREGENSASDKQG